LHEPKAPSLGGGFHLRDQARFTDACFPAQQGNVPAVTFRLLKQPMESGEFGGAPDQHRAND